MSYKIYSDAERGIVVVFPPQGPPFICELVTEAVARKFQIPGLESAPRKRMTENEIDALLITADEEGVQVAVERFHVTANVIYMLRTRRKQSSTSINQLLRDGKAKQYKCIACTKRFYVNPENLESGIKCPNCGTQVSKKNQDDLPSNQRNI